MGHFSTQLVLKPSNCHTIESEIIASHPSPAPTPSTTQFVRLRNPPALYLNIDIDQRNRRGRHTRNARGLSQGLGFYALKFFVHLAGEAADRAVVKPFGNHLLFRFLQTLDGLALLVEVAGVLDLRLHGLHLIARGG